MKNRVKHCLPMLWIVICFFLIPQKICKAENIEIESIKSSKQEETESIGNSNQEETESIKNSNQEETESIGNSNQEEIESIGSSNQEETESIEDFNYKKIESIEDFNQEGEKNIGEGMEETLEQYLSELNFSDIDDFLMKQESTQTLDFQELIKKLIAGEEIDKKQLLEEIFNMIFNEIKTFRGMLVQIVLLCMVFAILYNFADVFENPAVTEISFYIVYMLLLILLMQSFFLLRDVSTEVISEMMIFLKVLIPTFTVSMAFSGQITSAAGFYEMTFFLIYGLEWVMQYLIIPSIQIYMILELMNYLMEEELLSRMTDLLKSSILWVMKLLFTIVIGINVVQNLLTPVIDTFKTNLISKTAGMLPGLGTSINAVTEIMVGSGIIIKNGIGLAAVFVLLILCAGPLIKVGVMTFLYKLLAAVIQPISGKQLIGCINSAGESSKLLGKVVVTTTVMFLVTIAMITAATTFIH